MIRVPLGTSVGAAGENSGSLLLKEMGGREARAAEVNDAITPPRGESLGLPGASQGDPKTKPSEQNTAWREAKA